MIPKLLAILLLAQGTILAQDEAAANETAQPQPPPAPVVLSTRIKRIEREEPAPLPDMKAIRKTVTVTIQRVEPVPEPEPPAAIPAPDPEALARFREMAAKRQKPVFIMLSATVYDNENTLLRWHPNGRSDLEMTAWSNVNFEFLRGRSRFTHYGTDYYLFMGMGHESTGARRRTAERLGKPFTPPVIPALPPDETPAFVVTNGDAADHAATAPITALHEYFDANSATLMAEWAACEQSRIEYEAYIRAHPPEPQDVLIRYAAGTRPAPATP